MDETRVHGWLFPQGLIQAVAGRVWLAGPVRAGGLLPQLDSISEPRPHSISWGTGQTSGEDIAPHSCVGAHAKSSADWRRLIGTSFAPARPFRCLRACGDSGKIAAHPAGYGPASEPLIDRSDQQGDTHEQ